MKRPRGHVALSNFMGTFGAAVREAAEDQGVITRDPTKWCKHCKKFYAKFRCSRVTHLECDCPKCQGYCECKS